MTEELKPVDMRKQLSEGVVEITFTKKDGTLRVLNGTTDLGRIPKEAHPKGTRPPSDYAIPVFDLDLAEWRSFSADKVKSFILK